MKNTTKGMDLKQLTSDASDTFYDNNTVYPRILVRTFYGIYREYYNKAIKDLPFFDSYWYTYNTIYIINSDDTHTLVWRDGKLVR